MALKAGSSLDEEERVYAVEILRLGVDRFKSLPVVELDSKNEKTKLVTTPLKTFLKKNLL